MLLNVTFSGIIIPKKGRCNVMKSENPTMFQKRLNSIRKDKQITLSDLGAHCGYSHSAVVKWENGQCEPSIATLIKIADYFDVSLDYLLGRTEVAPLTETQQLLFDKIKNFSDKQIQALLSIIK